MANALSPDYHNLTRSSGAANNIFDSASDTGADPSDSDGSNTSLDKHQVAFQAARASSEPYLRNYLPHTKDLEEQVPLERFQAAIATPENDLGDFEKLPQELKDMVLYELDLKSLLNFGKINRSAVNAVKGLTGWNEVSTRTLPNLHHLLETSTDDIQVMTCTPDTIRMVICIDTTHLHTLKQLSATLAKRTCAHCKNKKPSLAPYLDMFTLKRRCLDVGGMCFDRGSFYSITDFVPPSLPIPIDDEDWTELEVPENEVQRIKRKVPSFRSKVGVISFGSGLLKITAPSTYYDADMVADAVPSHGFTIYQDTSPGAYTKWSKLPTVFAPWPVKADGKFVPAAMGTFCGKCRVTSGHIPGAKNEVAVKSPFFEDCANLKQHVDMKHDGKYWPRCCVAQSRFVVLS